MCFQIGSGTGSNTSSPVLRPVEFKATDVITIPHFHDSSPHSSAPSTPNEDRDRPPRSGHRRTDSITIEGEDYFLPAGRFSTTDSSSAPVSPQAATSRNISFSPRIQFHDTWPSGEYDRRGEVATCNRLTPLLAQQIKEELNTFKMVRITPLGSFKIYTCIYIYTVTNHSMALRRKWKSTNPQRFIHTSSNEKKEEKKTAAAFNLVVAGVLFPLALHLHFHLQLALRVF